MERRHPTDKRIGGSGLAYLRIAECRNRKSSTDLTITNSGGIALAITSISSALPFRETDDCVHTVVNSGASCVIHVIFTPDRVGRADGELTISANISGGQIAVPLTGTGFATGSVTAAPGALDFGRVPIGATSVLLPVTLENAGSTHVAITSVTATPPFQVAANSCGVSLAGHSACSLSITFAPSQQGTASGNLVVVDEAGTQTVALNGTGAAAATDTLSATSLTFGSTVIGQGSSPEVITLSNDGDLPLNDITTITTAGFQVSNTCGGSLGAHASCTVSVVFAPNTVGQVTGTLIVSDAVRSQIVRLSGTGLQAPAIKVSPIQITFSVLPVGQTSTPVALTITNIGGAPMANIGLQITGSAASSFSWSASTCGASLINGSSCSVQLAFAPGSASQLAATLVVSSSTAGVFPVQVPLSGIGQGSPGISISPSQMNFTQPKLGDPSAAQVATILNKTNLTASGLVLAASTPFSLAKNTCGSSLGPGTSCSTEIVFTPIANGVVSGTLSVSSSIFTSPAIAGLTGAGGAAGSIQVQPGFMQFPLTGVGLTGTPQSLVLTNNSPVTLADLKLSTSPGFAATFTTCGTSLEAETTCVVQIAFAPTNAGQQRGSLTITSASLAAPAEVALSGIGFDFILETAGPTSKTVSSGQTATYMLTLAPLNGTTGTFVFSCRALPANSSCSFNPTSESVPANATGSFIVNIATGVSSSGASLPPAAENRTPWLFPLVCLLMLPFAAGYRKRKLFLLSILMAGLAGIASCAGAGGGGGGTPVSPNGSTPPGKYSVEVAASASGISRKATITLVVD